MKISLDMNHIIMIINRNIIRKDRWYINRLIDGYWYW
jgi:hypothetical protein